MFRSLSWKSPEPSSSGLQGTVDAASENDNLRTIKVYILLSMSMTPQTSARFLPKRNLHESGAPPMLALRKGSFLSNLDVRPFVEFPIVAQSQDHSRKKDAIGVTTIGRAILVAVLLYIGELLTPFRLPEESSRAGKATPFALSYCEFAAQGSSFDRPL